MFLLLLLLHDIRVWEKIIAWHIIEMKCRSVRVTLIIPCIPFHIISFTKPEIYPGEMYMTFFIRDVTSAQTSYHRVMEKKYMLTTHGKRVIMVTGCYFYHLKSWPKEGNGTSVCRLQTLGRGSPQITLKNKNTRFNFSTTRHWIEIYTHELNICVHSPGTREHATHIHTHKWGESNHYQP